MTWTGFSCRDDKHKWRRLVHHGYDNPNGILNRILRVLRDSGGGVYRCDRCGFATSTVFQEPGWKP